MTWRPASTRRCLLAAVAALLAVLLPATTARGQAKGAALTVVGVDAESYPRIFLTLDYADAHGSGADTLPDADLHVRVGEPAIEGEVAGVEAAAEPLAVAIVIDRSPAMADVATPLSERSRDLAVQVSALLDRLPADSRIALIAFDSAATVAFPLTADGGGARNTLGELLKESLPEQAARYALGDAMALAAAELAKAPASPAAVFVFGAGSPDAAVDRAALREALTPPDKAPVSVTIVGLGSDQAGAFTTTPGDPEGLRNLAGDLGGVFLPYYAADIAAVKPLAEALFERYELVIKRRIRHRIAVELGPLGTGEQRLEVTLGDSSAVSTITIPPARPQVRVRVPATDLQGVVRLSSEVIFAQTPLQQVEYILNNIPLGTASTPPDFAFELDTGAPLITRSFQVGEEYELFVAATDQSGAVNRSEPIRVRLLAPPPPSGFPARVMAVVREHGPLALTAVLVLVALGGGFVLFRRLRRDPNGRGGVADDPEAGAESNPLRKPTARHEQAAQRRTARFQQSAARKTARYGASEPRAVAFQILLADKQRVFTLSPSKRVCTIGFDAGNDIQLDDSFVSGLHARLNLSSSGVEIMDLNSLNGVFVGAEKLQLTPNQPHLLHDNATFWIGPKVSLSIKQVGV